MAVHVSIRPVEQRDLDAVVDMIGALAAHHGDTPSITAQQLAMEALGSGPSIRILVAEADRRLIGYVVLRTVFDAIRGGRSANLDHFFVVTEHRNQGIGRQLMDAAIEAARSFGCSGLMVQTTSQNWKAHEVYAALGFEPMTPADRVYWRRT